ETGASLWTARDRLQAARVAGAGQDPAGAVGDLWADRLVARLAPAGPHGGPRDAELSLGRAVASRGERARRDQPACRGGQHGDPAHPASAGRGGVAQRPGATRTIPMAGTAKGRREASPARRMT